MDEQRYDDDVCQKCGYPFLTSMRNTETDQWAAVCPACGWYVWLTPEEPVDAS